MYETGKTTQVDADMTKFNLIIIGIIQSRWPGSGQSGRLPAMFSEHVRQMQHTLREYQLCFCSRHIELGWEEHGQRIMTASYHTN
ncbi:hypothetical protein DPMN_079370 [Dreissena polymorpha]|uniref:Uncharacterized protein n=1 Tax=Dreissena polymorpha TaxID=45954 RepID=A0A9D4BQ03_DREPO|nr:hypothetical protein DPMN_079370 [Dreissena polymorpha]